MTGRPAVAVATRLIVVATAGSQVQAVKVSDAPLLPVSQGYAQVPGPGFAKGSPPCTKSLSHPQQTGAGLVVAGEAVADGVAD